MSKGIADWFLPSSGIKTASAVAPVIHTASDQALRDPEQAYETGREEQEKHGRKCEADAEKLPSAQLRHLSKPAHPPVSSRGMGYLSFAA